MEVRIRRARKEVGPEEGGASDGAPAEGRCRTDAPAEVGGGTPSESGENGEGGGEDIVLF